MTAHNVIRNRQLQISKALLILPAPPRE